MRKLLIITALFTGHGHKSIADALEERLAIYDDIQIKTIDGFALMNRFEQYMAEYTYGPITRMPGKAWEWNYAAGKAFLRPLTHVIAAVITFLGMTLADIVAGSLVIEQVFSIPGYGRLLISSIANRDYPVVQAIIAIIAMIVIVINMIVDIMYKVLDPRMRDNG